MDFPVRRTAGAAILVIFALSAIMVSSCTKIMQDNNTNNGGQQGSNEVFIQGMAYSPSTLTVPAGTTVIWTNKDAVNHTVTSDNAMFESGNMAKDVAYSFKFESVGTYLYHCKLHPSMTARIIVN